MIKIYFTRILHKKPIGLSNSGDCSIGQKIKLSRYVLEIFTKQ